MDWLDLLAVQGALIYNMGIIKVLLGRVICEDYMKLMHVKQLEECLAHSKYHINAVYCFARKKYRQIIIAS